MLMIAMVMGELVLGTGGCSSLTDIDGEVVGAKMAYMQRYIIHRIIGWCRVVSKKTKLYVQMSHLTGQVVK